MIMQFIFIEILMYYVIFEFNSDRFSILEPDPIRARVEFTFFKNRFNSNRVQKLNPKVQIEFKS